MQLELAIQFRSRFEHKSPPLFSKEGVQSARIELPFDKRGDQGGFYDGP
jgi:hypothetical protein